MSTFAERLKSARVNAKLSQASAAKKAGMSQPNLSELENGKYPSSTFVPKLASIYGVSALWLSSGEDTLADRLLEICGDLELPTGRGRNAALSELLGLSSGRVSQLFPKDGTRDPNVRLSEEALRRLVAKGYNADWIQGSGDKKFQVRARSSAVTASPGDLLKVVEMVLGIAGVPLSALVPDIEHAKERLAEALSEQRLPYCQSMSLTRNLQTLMDSKGENANSLAAKSGVPQPTIFRILKGESKDPRRGNVLRLAKALGVSADDLYGKHS